MRAINYLKSRFEFALKNKKPMHLNDSDVEALNQIIEFINENKINTELEDSLILFWIQINNKISFAKDREEFNELMIEKKAVIIPNLDRLLENLRTKLKPKSEVVSDICSDIQTQQLLSEIKRENWVTYSEVSKCLDSFLKSFKSFNNNYKKIFKL